MTTSDELAKKLLQLDEDTLKAQLKIRAKQISEDTTARSASLESLDEDLSATPRGFSLDITDVNFGAQMFENLNVKSYDLMCGEFFNEPELKEKFLAAYKENSEKAASLLAPILVSHLGLASSVAMIVAVLIIKTLVSATSTIASATSQTICDIWKTTLVEEKDLSNSGEKVAMNSL